MRCVAEEAINAVLNRIKIRSIEGNVVSMDVVAAGHSDDRAILVANLALSGVVARWRHRDGPAATLAGASSGTLPARRLHGFLLPASRLQADGTIEKLKLIH